MLFVGAVRVNAPRNEHYGNSVTVSRTPNLPFDRQTLCHWDNHHLSEWFDCVLHVSSRFG